MLKQPRKPRSKILDKDRKSTSAPKGESVDAMVARVKRRNAEGRIKRLEKLRKNQTNVLDLVLFHAEFAEAARETHGTPMVTPLTPKARGQLKNLLSEWPHKVSRTEFVRWCATEWGFVRSARMKWLEGFPDQPDMNTMAQFGRFFVQAWAEKDTLHQRLTGTPLRNEYRRLRAIGIPEAEAMRQAKEMEEYSSVRKKIDDANVELQNKIDMSRFVQRVAISDDEPVARKTRTRVSGEFEAPKATKLPEFEDDNHDE